MSGDDKREPSLDATESKTLGTLGNSMRENREAQKTPSVDSTGGRPEKAVGRTSGVNVFGESDDLIVPTKRANKAGQPAAEPVEGRGSTKGNALQTAAGRAQHRKPGLRTGKPASIGLDGVRSTDRYDPR